MVVLLTSDLGVWPNKIQASKISSFSLGYCSNNILTQILCLFVRNTPRTHTHTHRQQHKWVWYDIPPIHPALSDVGIHGPIPRSTSTHSAPQPSPSHQRSHVITTRAPGAKKSSISPWGWYYCRHCGVRHIDALCMHCVWLCSHFISLLL